MKIINKLSDIIFSIEKLIAIILASVLLISLASGVLFRTLKSPLFWSDELAIFCLIWMTFIGGSMGLKKNASPSITIVTDLLSQNAKKVVLFVGNLILLVFIGYLLFLAYQWISMPNIKVQTSTAMNIPKLYFYLCIPVSFVFMVIHVFNNLFLSFKTIDEAGDLN
ncbi:TRAP transporter small permease [Lysinibacillus macroides]|uniref:TRAP transporter small permease n=1 Tax=Lysinibacillus macroides TaxID=33935 RepID=UPI0006B5D0B0|nr:TRAP transporter small permease [Lysinibacillus macroides]QPR68104.1 TRAP transporter small permease [Lysinibacillus macroides]